MMYRRHACERCHQIKQRYSSGKRIRCPKCLRLIGRNCCASILSYIPLPDGRQFPIHGDTCVDCVASTPAPSQEV